jgi:hypothetical protein
VLCLRVLPVAQLSGSFWLSRLLRDRDATLRVLAVQLLAVALQPGAAATQTLVAQVGRARAEGVTLAVRSPPPAASFGKLHAPRCGLLRPSVPRAHPAPEPSGLA